MSRLERDRAAALAASIASQAKAKRENAKMRHTPGPWVVRTIDQSLATVETQDGEYIICNAAQLRGDDWKTEHAERKANARLIAAAPELLAALQRLVSVIEKQVASPHLAERASPLAQAKAAIEKATGETA